MITALTSYALQLAALILPQWLVTPLDAASSGSYAETQYGLFVVCQSATGECRAFPREENGDCTQEYFCPLWHVAGTTMILASVIGALTLVALLGTMCSQRRKRERGWKMVTSMLVLHTVPSATTMVILLDLLYNSTTTTISISMATPTNMRHGISMIFAFASLCINLLMALAILSFRNTQHQQLQQYDHQNH
ncbi:predicted protein [Lichtheimia corymbifera JMRC:FSU:9682]|uniref:Uncharacterized protein n=1 Tax=Lichtheimia corymbifera JMRC:FSU:9682 TaxID=1263082 RepID=A0A068RPP5_9FUNG|nr:predicted protein [Lichtheimia corymbifera JMRC:FSU:9682]